MSNEPQSARDDQNESGSVPPPDAELEIARDQLMRMAFVVEGGLMLLGLVVGYFGFFDWKQPLSAVGAVEWRNGLIWGGVGTIPLLLYLAAFHLFSPGFLQPIREFVDEHLKPLFKQCSLLELLTIAMLAGFCEELFFRWCLQGGITSVSHSLVAGLLVASVIFGLCHWVNSSYGITTALIGMYLGGLMVWTGTWLAPAIAHVCFDFVALLYIARFEGQPERARHRAT